jgi:hypothetical protein
MKAMSAVMGFVAGEAMNVSKVCRDCGITPKTFTSMWLDAESRVSQASSLDLGALTARPRRRRLRSTTQS